MEGAKDYTNWHNKKAHIQKERQRPFFHEREVWWCSLGVNVGYEQDGSGQHFIRPVLIFKEFSKDFFMGIPLTRTKKTGMFYSSLQIEGATSTALLSQVRSFDAKRLRQKLGVVCDEDYFKIKKALTLLLFG